MPEFPQIFAQICPKFARNLTSAKDLWGEVPPAPRLLRLSAYAINTVLKCYDNKGRHFQATGLRLTPSMHATFKVIVSKKFSVLITS